MRLYFGGKYSHILTYFKFTTGLFSLPQIEQKIALGGYVAFLNTLTI